MKWIRCFSAAVAFAGLSMTAEAAETSPARGGGAKSCGCAEDCQPVTCRPTITRPCAPTVYSYQRKQSTLKPPCCAPASAQRCCAPMSRLRVRRVRRNVCASTCSTGTGCGAAATCGCGDSCCCGQRRPRRFRGLFARRRANHRCCGVPAPLTCSAEGDAVAGCGECDVCSGGKRRSLLSRVFRRNCAPACDAVPAPLTCGDNACADDCADGACAADANCCGENACNAKPSLLRRIFRRNSCATDGCGDDCAAADGCDAAGDDCGTACADGCADACAPKKVSLLRRIFRRGSCDTGCGDSAACGNDCAEACSGCPQCAVKVPCSAPQGGTACGNGCGERCAVDNCALQQLVHASMTACYARQRRAAVSRLGRSFSCTCSPEVMNALVYALNDADERVRAEAADQIGNQLRRNRCCCSEEVASALTAALGDCDRRVRREAERALRACGYEVVDGCCNNGCGDAGCGEGAAVPVTPADADAAPADDKKAEEKAADETVPAPAPPTDPNAYFPSRLRNSHASRAKRRSRLASLFRLPSVGF